MKSIGALIIVCLASHWARAGQNSWSFEESSGTNAFDSSGVVNGVLLNGASRITTGRSGRAIQLDGINDLISFSDHSVFHSESLSVAVWIKRDGSQPNWAKILSKGGLTQAPWGSFKLEFNGSSDSQIVWHMGFEDGGANVVSNPAPLPDNEWIFLVGTYSAGLQQLYVNGQLVAQRSDIAKAIKFDNSPLTIGSGGFGDSFKGSVDEAKFFDYALKAEDVLALYNQIPNIVVTQPSAAATWAIGTVQAIRWTHNLPANSQARVEVSRDSGVNWSLMGSVPVGSNVFYWTVSGSESANAIIRVQSTSPSAIGLAPAAISLKKPLLRLISPNLSSDVWLVGQSTQVSWSENLGPSEFVRLKLSLDNGSTYPITIADKLMNDGNEVIQVRPEWVTANAKLKIIWVRKTSLTDVSDQKFSVITSSANEHVFTASNEIFPNPDRGFFTWTNFLTDPDFNHVRSAGNTLTRPYIRLDSYRDSALPQSLLTELRQGFEKAKASGIKVIMRFSYNFGPYPNSEPDASKQRILEHLQQLGPILKENEALITSMEAGFIGAWGEWHTSTNGLDTNPSAKAEILNALLNAMPTSRMVALRYPSDIQLLNGAPISATEAFSGSHRSRVGNHQDCFLASDNDWGTWGRGGQTIQYDKDFIAANGLFAVVGGETCNVNPPRSDCATALSELQKMHWSYLNNDYEPQVLQGFKNGGCFDEINRRLGYRFELRSAQFSEQTSKGASYSIKLDLFNSGFAAVFNQRPAFLVLEGGGRRYEFELGSDVRRWAPSVLTSISQQLTLPIDIPNGVYTLALWLPDQSFSLRSNPNYSVRLANVGLWDSQKGYNVLSRNISVSTVSTQSP